MLIIEILLIIASAIWIQQGIVEYGLMSYGVPGSGFFPLVAGCIVFALSVLDIVLRIVNKKPINGKMKSPNQKECLMLSFIPCRLRPIFVVAYGFFGILLLNLFGIIVACLLTCGLWLFFVSKKGILQSIMVSVITTGVLYGVFVLWLRVPFPRGIIF